MRTIGILCMVVGIACILSGFVVTQQTAGQTRSSISAPAAPVATPTPTAIPYPSRNDAEAAIMYYYVKQSVFAGKNIIQHFDSVTYGMQVGEPAQPQFTACAQYQYALVSSPNITADTVRHPFTFQYENGTWIVIDMGNLNSC